MLCWMMDSAEHELKREEQSKATTGGEQLLMDSDQSAEEQSDFG